MFNSMEMFLLDHRLLLLMIGDLYQDLIGIYVDSNEEYQLMIRTNHLIDQIDR
jgi:hypothetical protein